MILHNGLVSRTSGNVKHKSVGGNYSISKYNSIKCEANIYDIPPRFRKLYVYNLKWISDIFMN
jgi:hypothetical protein